MDNQTLKYIQDYHHVFISTKRNTDFFQIFWLEFMFRYEIIYKNILIWKYPHIVIISFETFLYEM